MGRTRLSCAALMMFALVGCGRPPEDRAEALRQAAGRGNVAEVRSLIARGADLDARDPTGKTALFNALHNREIIELLLAHGADINAQDRWGFTPLHAALRSRAVDVARLLINRGAHIQTRSHDNETPLHAAAEIDDVEIVRLLVRRGADVNGATSIGDTPLLRAARQGHHDIAQHLIAEGADVNIRAREEPATPVHAAIEIGHKHLVQFLLDSGAAVDASDLAGRSPATRAMQKNFKDIVTILAKAGATIDLHLAAYLGDVETARRLLDSGTDVDLRDSRSWTPLHYAAQRGRTEIAELLIARGANVDAEDRGGVPPLRRAVFQGTKEVVDLLLAHGAEIDLHLAAYIGRVDEVKELLANGVDVNLQYLRTESPLVAELSAVYPEAIVRHNEPCGDAALHRAIQGGHSDVVEFLATSGADLEACGDKGQTPLHDAAYLGFAEIARALIAAGADVNAIAEDCGYGTTALQMAAHGGHTATMALLLAHGADVDAKDTQGRAALFHAWENGFADVVALLGGDANDPELAQRKAYTVVIRDPAALKGVLSSSEYDGVWIPTESDLEGLDSVLRSYLTDNTAIQSEIPVDREHVLANLRRYSREYAGFVSGGRKCIFCNMILADWVEAPDGGRFSSTTGRYRGIVQVVFDVDKRVVLRIYQHIRACF